MDDLFGCLIIFGAIIAGVMLAVYLIGLALAFLLELLLGVAETVGPVVLLIVLILGLSIPVATAIKAIRARAEDAECIITPADVAEGDFFGRPPTGPSAGFGWDRAWARYVPYQAWRDYTFVASELWRVFRLSAVKAFTLGGVLTSPRWLQIIVFVLVTMIWYVCFAVVYAFGALTILGLLGSVLAAVWLAQFVSLWGLRALDSGYRKLILKSSSRCPNAGCYHVTPLPSYTCPNPDCTVIHRDVRPGRQGVLFHRCECSALVATTVLRASRAHESVCPACGGGMPSGVGTRRTVSFPVVGDVGAGKTRFVQTAVVALEDRCQEKGSGFSPLTDQSEIALDEARRVTGVSGDSIKTPVDLPVAYVYGVSPAKGPELEVHLVDAAGEHFQTLDSTGELRYLDSAEVLIFVVDPLGVDSVRHEFEQASSTRLPNLSSRPEEAYSTIIEVLKTNGIDPMKKSLAVVVSKADMILGLPSAASIDPSDDATISEWLSDNYLDNLATRTGRDFGEVRFFVVDSKLEEDLDSPTHPFHVLEWCANKSGARFYPADESEDAVSEQTPDESNPGEMPLNAGEKATS
ncbi:TRAFAC clade GTPase domain-containing protein [Dietzia kunjamensis]|uniref:TRAFAC clade GTPase domain-containing protein n=1 Tax=Dietzia kunjamensis TaxID=322509 RepID=UPI0039BC75BF